MVPCRRSRIQVKRCVRPIAQTSPFQGRSAAALAATAGIKRQTQMPGAKAGHRGIPELRRESGGGLGLRGLLVDLLLELERLRRQLVRLGLLEEGIKPAAMIDGLERVGRDAQLDRTPSASDISVTLIRFGRKRRLVLMFEWLTVWPDRGPFRSARSGATCRNPWIDCTGRTCRRRKKTVHFEGRDL